MATCNPKFFLIIATILTTSSPVFGKTASNFSTITAAVEEVNDLRTALARTLPSGAKVDEATFAQVCKPVGARVHALSQEHGWTFIQMSDKFRNPKHKADSEGEKAINAFRSDAKLQSFWTTTQVDGKGTQRYFRRITVDQPCLACHGNSEARPAFIKAKYPEDRAFGFAVGDLRGVYSVAWTE